MRAEQSRFVDHRPRPIYLLSRSANTGMEMLVPAIPSPLIAPPEMLPTHGATLVFRLLQSQCPTALVQLEHGAVFLHSMESELKAIYQECLEHLPLLLIEREVRRGRIGRAKQ